MTQSEAMTPTMMEPFCTFGENDENYKRTLTLTTLLQTLCTDVTPHRWIQQWNTVHARRTFHTCTNRLMCASLEHESVICICWCKCRNHTHLPPLEGPLNVLWQCMRKVYYFEKIKSALTFFRWFPFTFTKSSVFYQQYIATTCWMKDYCIN